MVVGRRGGDVGESPGVGEGRAGDEGRAGGPGGDNFKYLSENKYSITFYVVENRKYKLCNLTIYANNIYYCLHIL